MSEIKRIKIRWFALATALTALFLFVAAGDTYSRDDFSVGGFIDEDGDGFNDLLPDSDGDGVPDGLDPDSEVGMPDSGYMYRYMHNFQEQHQMIWENMNGDMPGGHMEHGEPGMYGPGDSTMHGGEGGGGHHGGGMGGGMDDGGGMGPGGGMDPGGGMGPDSEGGVRPGAENQLVNPAKQETTPVPPEKTPLDQNRQSGDGIDQRLDITPADNNPGGE